VKIIAGAGPEAQFVAAARGTDLYPNMKRRQQTPRTVISVMRLPELNQITGDGGSGAVIGASVILTDICEHPIIKARLSRHPRAPCGRSRRRSSATWERLVESAFGHALQLLRSELRMAQRHQFLPQEDGDVCWVAPGSSKCWAVQSSDLVPVIGGNWREVSFGFDAGRADDRCGRIPIYDDGTRLSEEARGRITGRDNPSAATDKWLARFVSEASPPRRFRFSGPGRGCVRSVRACER